MSDYEPTWPETRTRFTFIKEPAADGSDPTRVQMDVTALRLSVVVEEVESFLRACGFNPAGHLDFVTDNETGKGT